jgi:hypothetical protein
MYPLQSNPSMEFSSIQPGFTPFRQQHEVIQVELVLGSGPPSTNRKLTSQFPQTSPSPAAP